MTNSIYPCFWYDGQAKAAAGFYCSAFGNFEITEDNSTIAVILKYSANDNDVEGKCFYANEEVRY